MHKGKGVSFPSFQHGWLIVHGWSPSNTDLNFSEFQPSGQIVSRNKKNTRKCGPSGNEKVDQPSSGHRTPLWDPRDCDCGNGS
jgi:hypothetical protein